MKKDEWNLQSSSQGEEMKTFAVRVKSCRSLMPLLWGLLVLWVDQLLEDCDLSSITVPWGMCCHHEDSNLATGDPKVQGYLTDRSQRWQEMLSPGQLLPLVGASNTWKLTHILD